MCLLVFFRNHLGLRLYWGLIVHRHFTKTAGFSRYKASASEETHICIAYLHALTTTNKHFHVFYEYMAEQENELCELVRYVVGGSSVGDGGVERLSCSSHSQSSMTSESEGDLKFRDNKGDREDDAAPDKEATSAEATGNVMYALGEEMENCICNEELVLMNKNLVPCGNDEVELKWLKWSGTGSDADAAVRLEDEEDITL
ncbi:hypothetical protein C5167_006160 [Papaver somniferum]|uniref:Uncharacterized protein n=1 Tax=Papaver somniferum TaxID=3469 RepID=A0A4Y7JFN6_PAPSO|nr:hypothetical protein C5167_006160 [Papaver somniferum]